MTKKHDDLNEGPIKPSGIGLRTGERAALDEIAASLGVARNAVLRFAIRWFIIQWREGKVDMTGFVEEPEPQKNKLRLPGV